MHIHVDWDVVRLWAQAGAAVFAAGASATAAFFAYRAWVREGRRDDERRTVAESAMQADLVAAWIGQRIDPTPAGGVPLGWGSRPYFVAELVNRSALPVYDVEVRFVRRTGAALARDTLAVLPPVLPDRDPTSVLLDPEVLRQLGDVDPREQLLVELRFTDAAGRTWSRDHRGTLTREP